jgi:hypothetical protein
MSSELLGAVSLGDPTEVREVVHRLLDLPEFGGHGTLESIRKFFDMAEEAENKAKAFRKEAREIAERLVKSCQKHWTPAQMYKATGYDNPRDK